jgi:integrase
MVTIRARGKGWQYDIIFRWPDGSKFRERAKAPVANKSAAQRWAEARERSLLAAGREAHEATKVPPAAAPAASPTLNEFWPIVVRDHYRANRKKASTIDAAEAIFRLHLAPVLGQKTIDAIATADVAALKGKLSEKSPKTVNNILTVLSRALRCAVEWGTIAAMPCRIAFFKAPDPTMQWYEREDYRRLVDAATKRQTAVLVLVLLAGDAGLRRGEIRALKWSDLDLARGIIHVRRGMWRGHEATPKGNRGRDVPMTPALRAALGAHRHLVGERVLYSDRGREVSNRTVRSWLASAQRRAGLEADGGIHILRHTFCSHLAAAGVTATAIKELAGHADLATTQRYMHLSPADRSTAMTVLAAYHAGEGVAPGRNEPVARRGPNEKS